MPRSNPQQDEKYCSCDPRQTHGDFHNKIGQRQSCECSLPSLYGLNHSDELPPLPIDPRPSAERPRAATEIATAVTGPNEVANIDIRRRCETSQCFP